MSSDPSFSKKREARLTWKADAQHKIKKLATSYSRTSGRRTTLGDGALDFRVRNGNGYDSSSMVTSKRGKLGVKESCDPLRDASRLRVKQEFKV